MQPDPGGLPCLRGLFWETHTSCFSEANNGSAGGS